MCPILVQNNFKGEGYDFSIKKMIDQEKENEIMKRRIWTLLVVATLGLGLFSGCGTGTSGANVNLKNMQKADKIIMEALSSDAYKMASEDELLEKAKSTVEQLVEEKLVVEESVKVIEETGSVSFQYVGGGTATIQTKPLQEEVTEEVVTAPSVSEIEVIVAEEATKAEQTGAPVVETPEELPVTSDPSASWSKQEEPVIDVVYEPSEDEEKVTAFSVRVYNAFEDYNWRNANYTALLDDWVACGLANVTYDDEVHVEELLSIADYSMVSFSMHGTLTYTMTSGVTPVIVLLDDVASNERDKELQSYLAKNEVVKLYHADGACYAITPSFFAGNLAAESLSNTIVYSESCDFLGECHYEVCDRASGVYCSTGTSSYPDALCGLGALSVMGFHNSVNNVYAVAGLDVVGQLVYLGYTPEVAYVAFTDWYGLTDDEFLMRNYGTHKDGVPAYLLLYGNNITCTSQDLLKPVEGEVVEPETVEEQEQKDNAISTGRMTRDEQVAFVSESMGWDICTEEQFAVFAQCGIPEEKHYMLWDGEAVVVVFDRVMEVCDFVDSTATNLMSNNFLDYSSLDFMESILHSSNGEVEEPDIIFQELLNEGDSMAFGSRMIHLEYVPYLVDDAGKMVEQGSDDPYYYIRIRLVE